MWFWFSNNHFQNDFDFKSESSWLDIESKIDSTLRVKFTQLWESNWLNIERKNWDFYLKLRFWLKMILT